jgi:rhodanese-related sulfurtransferase
MDTMLDRAIALLVTAMSVAPGLPLCGESWRSGQLGAAEAGELEVGFGTITSDELVEKLAHKDFVFVNVHIPYEGEIERTDAFIPFDKIAENLDRLPSDRNAAVVLYCRSGRMSEIAAKDLASRGFTQVSHLAGGMVDWQKSGRQIVHR